MTDFDAERRRAWDQYAAAVLGSKTNPYHNTGMAARSADEMLAERDKRFPRPEPASDPPPADLFATIAPTGQ